MTREEFIKIMCEYLDVPTDDDVRFIGDIYDKIQQDFIDTDNFVMKFKKDKDNGRKDKELLLKDLCARLPHWVKVKVRYYYEYEDGTFKKYNEIKYFDAEILDLLISGDRSLDDIKPYLRPMSSMTEEEKKEYHSLCEIHFDNDADGNFMAYYFDSVESIDWLNKNMFDYRGLIPRDLALSTDKYNPYKN